MNNNIKVFNLYNATQHIIFSISFLENIIKSITDEKEINVYKNLVSNLQYIAEKICDLLELEVECNGGSIDLSDCEFTTVDNLSNNTSNILDISNDISEEIRDYIKQIQEEIRKEKVDP